MNQRQALVKRLIIVALLMMGCINEKDRDDAEVHLGSGAVCGTSRERMVHGPLHAYPFAAHWRHK